MTLNTPPLPRPETLVEAAFAMEPVDLPVDYSTGRSDTPEKEILIAKAGLKVGPLFGVPNPDGPFGQQSWLASYNDITLDEIGRGAPRPPKDVVREMAAEGLVDESGNILVPENNNPDYLHYQSYIYGKTPNNIAVASLYKFGPNPKAAIILEGINFLFRPQTSLLSQAVKTPQFQELPPDDRICTYSSLIFSAFRPQPVLFWAGMTSETLQNVISPNICTAPRLQGTIRARGEFGAARKVPARHQPFTLDIIASTLPTLVSTLIKDGCYPVNLDSRLKSDLTATLRETHLQETYDSDTRQSTARAMDQPVDVADTFLAQFLDFRLPLPQVEPPPSESDK